MDFEWVERSDAGNVRPSNQDFAGNGNNRTLNAHIFCVADGMGGYAFGEMASKLAVESVVTDFAAISEPDRWDSQVATLFQNAQHRLGLFRRRESIPQFGTTLAAVVFCKNTTICANVGDTRIYSFCKGALLQESVDHTMVNEWLRNGRISVEQARSHPRRHILTRALTGNDSRVTPHITINRQGRQCLYLIASDGLHGMLDDHVMVDILARDDLEAAADALLAAALANGGSDNITFQLVRPQRP